MEETVYDFITKKLAPEKKPKLWKIAVIFISALFLLGAAAGVLAYTGRKYQNRVLPGLKLDGVPIGGMEKSELAEFISKTHEKLVSEGVSFKIITLSGGAEKVQIIPFVSSEKESLAAIDSGAEAERLVNYGKSGNILAVGFNVVRSNIAGRNMSFANIAAAQEKIISEINKRASARESEPVNSNIKIYSLKPLSFEITSSSPGIVYDYANLQDRIAESWSGLRAGEIVINSKEEEPAIKESDLSPLAANLPNLFKGGAVALTYDDTDTKRKSKWSITQNQISAWLSAEKKNGIVSLALNKKELNKFFDEEIAPEVNVLPTDAKFFLNDEETKAIEFVPSHSGVTVDKEKMFLFLDDLVEERLNAGKSATTSLAVPIVKVEPRIKTRDANNLGINEALGVGYSNFSGSPRNRVLNIKNAVKNKLHGLLIPPEQEFSLINTLKPFTIDAGYLPELVIVGNRIKPEIAGGLCQIGTTMFRTAMNTGLPITARTNHGMVIPYYNDPRNGNPGTDATIYEPWPDLKYINDTGHYLLITTDMNTANGELYFTLWGTNDGRKGYYSAPKVSGWVPAGPSETIETDTLPPGKEECQSRHNGASASFTYTRELPNGEKKEEVFKSVYRAVPAICFVGEEEETEEEQCDPAVDTNGCAIAPASAEQETGVIVTDSAVKPTENTTDPPLTVE